MTGRREYRERIGFNIRRGRAGRAIDLIRDADRAGVGTVWMTMGATSSDTLTIFAAAAVQTEQVTFGTGIIPAFARHPLTLVSQALVLDDLASGRLKLGIGTSHRPTIEGAYHLPFDRPLEQLREYVQVLRPAIREGQVSFSGEYYSADARFPAPLPTPVMISALRENAFEMAGEITDGAISWLCPLHYLQTVARPAMERGAAKAGRDEVPPLVAHVSVSLETDRVKVRESARRELGMYAGAPFYQNMFADAGYPLGPDLAYSDDLLDHLILAGDEDALGEQLVQILDSGIDEVLVMLIPGQDQQAEEQRLLRLLGSI
jgi:alkanesulfonate monooxygenase SsuD/methylene tetrahydromethanopterin reductase-like flavin-dependent oxidoreductase (luciferase family)